MRLSEYTLSRIPQSVERFRYRRDQQGIGIVHLGIGAFHRAHQAWYTDLAIEAGDEGWGILGVSLRSDVAAHRLNPQNCLYSVTAADSDTSSTRVIGAVRQVVTATTQNGIASAVAAIAAPATRIVSLTVTEKGYARCASSESSNEVAQPIYPLLAAGLRRRRDADLPGLTLLSCDNLPSNGERLLSTLTAYLASCDAETADWISANCTFPSTMVDRIVPAPTPTDLKSAATILGLKDDAAVVTEPFSQWIIEDHFAEGRPGWEKVGVTFAADVRAFETAKLRMLNGAHSALAYLGLERGYTFVDQAIADPVLRSLIEALMRREAADSFPAAPGQDLPGYADLLLERFSNSAIRHRLDQIAIDGSQKIPQRWLTTIADRRARGVASPAIIAALAAWVRFVRGESGLVDDPLAGHFKALWKSEGAGGIAAALFSPRGTFAGALTGDEQCSLTEQLFPSSSGRPEKHKIRTT